MDLCILNIYNKYIIIINIAVLYYIYISQTLITKKSENFKSVPIPLIQLIIPPALS